MKKDDEEEEEEKEYITVDELDDYLKKSSSGFYAQKKIPHLKHPLFKKRRTYEPFYDEDRDYNTNAKSYYDYLARFNRFLGVITDYINRLLDRDIDFNNTDSIDFEKLGDWLDNGECEPDNYDDVLNISAVVNISEEVDSISFDHLLENSFSVPNGSEIRNDGLWSPDYAKALAGIDDSIGDIYNKIEKVEDRLDDLEKLPAVIQKIIDNLYKSGAITSDDIYNFEFKDGRDIATGNINLFGGTADGESFIRTSDDETENDITAGV